MAKHVEVAGDIVAAGSAAAGLILVYVGALSTGYSTFTAQERRSVKRSYHTRAWFALAGLVLFLISVALGLIGKWFDSDWEIVTALWLLLIGLAWVAVTAVLTVMEIG